MMFSDCRCPHSEQIRGQAISDHALQRRGEAPGGAPPSVSPLGHGSDTEGGRRARSAAGGDADCVARIMTQRLPALRSRRFFRRAAFWIFWQSSDAKASRARSGLRKADGATPEDRSLFDIVSGNPLGASTQLRLDRGDRLRLRPNHATAAILHEERRHDDPIASPRLGSLQQASQTGSGAGRQKLRVIEREPTAPFVTAQKRWAGSGRYG